MTIRKVTIRNPSQICGITRGQKLSHLCHRQSQEVLRIAGVHDVVIPGVGNDGILVSALMGRVIL